jgi:hypothetical protein
MASTVNGATRRETSVLARFTAAPSMNSDKYDEAMKRLENLP